MRKAAFGLANDAGIVFIAGRFDPCCDGDAGGNKAINPRALGAKSRRMIGKYLCNDAPVSKNT